jgi:hypothetical protein
VAETTEVLTPEEKAVVESFRQRMATPDPTPAVSVVNESLGSLLDGTKIQFQGGDPSWTPSPAPRGQARWAGRERRRLEAEEAVRSRAQKNHQTMLQQVEKATHQLQGRNAAETVQLIEMQSEHDREVFILAEELGQARSTVLSRAGFAVSNKVRDQYHAERSIVEEAMKDAETDA